MTTRDIIREYLLSRVDKNTIAVKVNPKNTCFKEINQESGSVSFEWTTCQEVKLWLNQCGVELRILKLDSLEMYYLFPKDKSDIAALFKLSYGGE